MYDIVVYTYDGSFDCRKCVRHFPCFPGLAKLAAEMHNEDEHNFELTILTLA